MKPMTLPTTATSRGDTVLARVRAAKVVNGEPHAHDLAIAWLAKLTAYLRRRGHRRS